MWPMNCVMANLEKDFPIWGALGSGQVTIWAEQMKASAPETEVLLKYGKSNGCSTIGRR